MAANGSDPYQLSRFVEAQNDSYATALEELRSGEKRSHWMWYIFPQVAGLGSSVMARRYALESVAEAEAYLGHPVLGARLIECAGALLQVRDRTAEKIMGYPDVLKLQSSMTLFSEVAGPDSPFKRVLEKYYNGAKDARTLSALQKNGAP